MRDDTQPDKAPEPGRADPLVYPLIDGADEFGELRLHDAPTQAHVMALRNLVEYLDRVSVRPPPKPVTEPSRY